MLQAFAGGSFRVKGPSRNQRNARVRADGDKGGPKLAQPAATDPPEPFVSIGNGILTGRRMNMPGLADALSSESDRIVLDRTELSGDYDLTLKWNPDGIRARYILGFIIHPLYRRQLGSGWKRRKRQWRFW